MKKSNIFAYIELKKLVDNLHHPSRALKENFVLQASYFHILDPKFFSEELSPEWNLLRTRLGYSPEKALQGQLVLKQSMRESIQSLSDAECRDIAARLSSLYARLGHEFDS